jgi:hypothetical protein
MAAAALGYSGLRYWAPASAGEALSGQGAASPVRHNPLPQNGKCPPHLRVAGILSSPGNFLDPSLGGESHARNGASHRSAVGL